ncbi:MAG TPA: PP2C family protein-serine/threonine phosphatase [Candidatus Acidoferrales bacterium]|nr:PP2C family protein-serine/threonine phosphatase [Candidatus Acidoferrales bacterium]
MAADRPKPARARGRISEFWQRVTEGRELEDLWAQFASEARAGYGHYSRELDWESIARVPRWKKPFRVAGALFWAMLMRLSPARRVLLLAALLLVLFGRLQFRSAMGSVDFDLLPAGIVILLLLLALELADRVIMKRDLEIAREIQQWLVPAAPPEVPGVDMAFLTRPANTVAGDYYDAMLRPAQDTGGGIAEAAPDTNRLLVVVADVAGKSVPAALLMATFQASLHALAALPTTLGNLVAGLNRYACAHSQNGLRYTTALLVEFEPAARGLRYVNAGHNAAVLRRALGRLERLEAGGLPLGIQAQASYEVGRLALSQGDLLVIFTDGVIEAVNEDGEEFGEQRLLEVLRTSATLSARETLDQLMAAVDGYAEGTRQQDDMTCLVLRAV